MKINENNTLNMLQQTLNTGFLKGYTDQAHAVNKLKQATVTCIIT